MIVTWNKVHNSKVKGNRLNPTAETYPYDANWSHHSQRRASSTMSTAAMIILKVTAALLSPAKVASLKWAYTMHMETRLKKKSPRSRSEASWPGGPG